MEKKDYIYPSLRTLKLLRKALHSAKPEPIVKGEKTLLNAQRKKMDLMKKLFHLYIEEGKAEKMLKTLQLTQQINEEISKGGKLFLRKSDGSEVEIEQEFLNFL